MSYESSNAYFDELSRYQQDWAIENLVLDALADGYYGNPMASDDPDYVRAYEVAEARRFAEIEQEAKVIAQRLEISRQRIDALGSKIASVRADFDSVSRKVEAGADRAVATLLRADRIGTELASLSLALEDEGEF